ncbi:hypothetical protein BWD162_012900 [Bartonella sp. WD16.2]|nr:hypothetical protein BWD162_012900 [Bartonella sp. WD16.2]
MPPNTHPLYPSSHLFPAHAIPAQPTLLPRASHSLLLSPQISFPKTITHTDTLTPVSPCIHKPFLTAFPSRLQCPTTNAQHFSPNPPYPTTPLTPFTDAISIPQHSAHSTSLLQYSPLSPTHTHLLSSIAHPGVINLPSRAFHFLSHGPLTPYLPNSYSLQDSFLPRFTPNNTSP